MRATRPAGIVMAAGMALIAVCYGFARFAYGLFVPALRTEFDLSGATTGLIAAGAYVGYCVAIVLAMVATPRVGGRAVAIAAAATATVGMALIAAAPTTAVLTVGAIVAGSSTGLASPPLAAAVAGMIRAERAGRAQAVVNAGTGLGVMVSGPVALLAAGQWRLAWWAFALVAALVGGWIAATLPGRGDEPPAAPRVGRRLPSGAASLFAAAAVMGVASAAMWTFGKDLMLSQGGIDEPVATWAWIVLGAAGLLGALSGDIVAGVGLPRAWLVAMLVLGVATALLTTAPGVPVVVFVATAAFGAAYIVLTALLLLRATLIYVGAPAFGVGAVFLVLALGQAMGAPVLGGLIDRVGPTGAFLVAAAIAAAGSVLWLTTGCRDLVPVGADGPAQSERETCGARS